MKKSIVFLLFINLFFFNLSFSQSQIKTKLLCLSEDSLTKKGEFYYYNNDIYTGLVTTHFLGQNSTFSPRKQMHSKFEVKEGRANGIMIIYREDPRYNSLNYQDSLYIIFSKNQFSQNTTEIATKNQHLILIQDSINLFIDKWGDRKINKFLVDEANWKLKNKFIPVVEEFHRLDNIKSTIAKQIVQLNESNDLLKKTIENEESKPIFLNQIFGKGLIINKLQNGLWTYYHLNNEILATGNFINGNQSDKNDLGIPRNGRDGNWTYFYENGNKDQELFYKDGKLNGVAISYNQNGNKIETLTYKDGKLNGAVFFYYNNGNKKQESIFKNDKLNGLTILFDESGIKKEESYYIDGKKNGISKYYFENGTTSLLQTMNNGRVHGPYKVYYESGRIHYSAFKDSTCKSEHKFIGELTEFNEDGSIHTKVDVDKNGIEKIIYKEKSEFEIAQEKSRNEIHTCDWCGKKYKGFGYFVNDIGGNSYCSNVQEAVIFLYDNMCCSKKCAIERCQNK